MTAIFPGKRRARDWSPGETDAYFAATDRGFEADVDRPLTPGTVDRGHIPPDPEILAALDRALARRAWKAAAE